MKHQIILLMAGILFGCNLFAQQEPLTREEKDEKNAARTARVNNKNDYATFRRQILALKQYEAERQKIPALRKESKMPVKVVAVIDSNDNDVDGEGKTLTGYIRQDVGDNTTNMYELTYDRAQKKIVSIKRTQEALDADREQQDEQQDTQGPAKKTLKKKSKDDDGDDEPAEKPVKGKHKDDDD